MRIIAGKNKGRKLVEFNFENIRPTSDLVKGALFNTLQSEIKDCTFLDLFGGTGSVGLEAVSRGAKHVVICDNNANSISVINKNNALVGGQARVIFNNFSKALNQLSGENVKFDIIFIDPPYDTTYGLDAINLIYNLKLLNENGVIVFEHHKNNNYSFNDYCEIVSQKTYGIKTLTYIEFKE